MKIICFLFAFFIFINFSIFGSAEDNAGEQEIDYLLFLPDSGSRFVNHERAMNQLDNLAGYLKDMDIFPGQIHVYGYSADFTNEIDPLNISTNRALLVINELVIRGVPRELFSDPVGRGAVDLWGSNTGEEGRSPNRRVRIVLDGVIVTPAVMQAVEPAVEIQEPPVVQMLPAETVTDEAETATDESKSKFPWWILLLLLLLALLLLFLSKRKRKKQPETVTQPPVASPAVLPVVLPAIVPAPVIIKTTVNLDEEIRYCAYMLYLERNGQNENADEDWHRAVNIVCPRYQSGGYQTYTENWSWWAEKQAGE